MAPNLSKLVTRKRLVCAASVSVVLWLISRKKKKNVRLRSTTIFKCWLLNGGTASLKLVVLPKNNNLQCKHPVVHDIQYTIGEKSPAKTKAQVDAVFFAQLKKILSICVKGIFTPESGFLILVASSLVARSLCDIWMIQNHTATENAIVTMDKMLFRKHLVEFFIAMPLISLVNNILKWSIGELKLRLRTQLTHYLYDEYLRGFTYYKMANLDTRIANADQLLTTDVDKFCDVFADLYSNVCKPVLDIFIYVYQLTTNLGGTTPGIMMIYLAIAGVFLTWLRRPAGRMTVWEQKLEGEFRYINSRLITNSEEIAFYSGSNREKLTVLTAFKKLTDHMRKFLEFRVLMGTVDNIIAKYFATVVGFFAVSLPFMSVGNQLAFTDKDERFKQYYSSGRMLVKLAEAIGRLVLAGREMTHLAGFTARVTEIMDVLKDINQGHYERTMIDDKRKEQNEIVALTEQNSHIKKPLIPGAGRIIYQDNVIRFDRVPLVTPNGDVLIEELTFEVKSGMNVLVCGPNGCGKSSLFRILGELWPLFGGCLTKPPRGKLFYIPQRPYMTLGTLRDQVIYPHTKEEMIRRGKTDASITEHLSRVQLSYLLQRENGWDTIADWIDVLSGGEKQRIAMARLFYHQPQFAILDECTSAVSVDVEGSMYQYCKETDITLFTVSHRRSLWKHHEYYLQMNGRGGFDFKPIDADTKEFGS